MKEIEKILVIEECSEQLHESDYDGTELREIISKLTEILAVAEGNGYSDVRLYIGQSWYNRTIDRKDFYIDQYSAAIIGKRIETDDEYEARKKKRIAARKVAEARREKKKEQDLKELARLQKKYGVIQ